MVEAFIKRLENLNERATTWLARVAAVLLAFMMAFTFVDVVGRGFNHPIVVTVEVTELLMGLIIYLGVGLTTAQKGHIQVDVLITYLPERVRAGLEVLTVAISIFFAVLLCWRLWVQAAYILESNLETQVGGVLVWPVAYIMAFCSMAISVGLVLQFFTSLFTVIRGDGQA